MFIVFSDPSMYFEHSVVIFTANKAKREDLIWQNLLVIFLDMFDDLELVDLDGVTIVISHFYYRTLPIIFILVL